MLRHTHTETHTHTHTHTQTHTHTHTHTHTRTNTHTHIHTSSAWASRKVDKVCGAEHCCCVDLHFHFALHISNTLKTH